MEKWDREVEKWDREVEKWDREVEKWDREVGVRQGTQTGLIKGVA